MKNRRRIDGPADFLDARKPFYLGMEIFGNVENWSVSWVFE
jgi:hypothetical protein